MGKDQQQVAGSSKAEERFKFLPAARDFMKGELSLEAKPRCGGDQFLRRRLFLQHEQKAQEERKGIHNRSAKSTRPDGAHRHSHR